MINDNLNNEEIVEKYNYFLQQKNMALIAGIVITFLFFSLFYLITNLIIFSIIFTTCVAYFCILTYIENFIDNSDAIKLKKLYKGTQKYTC